MKVSELKKLLKQHGCYHDGEFERHERWYSEKTGNFFPIPRHGSKEIASGTLNRILKDAGLK